MSDFIMIFLCLCAGFVLGAWAFERNMESKGITVRQLHDKHEKWCVEKAETKEQVLICHNGKFPWEK